jgi:PAS domain S-box-containing protein
MKHDTEKYHLLIENLPDAFAYHQIVIADDGTPVDYIFLEINSAFEEMTGLKREEIIGKKVTEVLPGIENAEFDWIGAYGKVALSGKATRFESFSEPLGRWYDVSAYSDKPGYFVAMFHDTTSQKQLEKSIIENKKRYQLIVDTQQEMICHYLPDTTLVFVNQAYCRTFGMSEAELIGRKFLEHTPSDYREKLVAIISSLTPQQPVITHEHQAVLPDGTLCWQEWTDQAIFNEAGELVEYQAVGRDITAHKQAEARLAESETKYRQLVENTHDIIYSLTPEGLFTYVSPAWTILLGHHVTEVEGHLFTEFVHPEDLSACFAFLQKVVKTGQRQEGVEYRVQHINGEWRWHTSSGTSTKNKDGLVTGFDGIARDITDRKEAEKALRLQASERAAVDAFTNSVSHDLQAPLRRIEGFSEALLEECQGELSEKARDYLDRIIRQIELMHERTDALLKLSSVVSHGIVHEEVNLSGLARSYLEKLRYAEPNRQVETVITPDLVVRGDINLLSIFLENLLENAWKFSVNEEKACIECGSILKDGRTVYFVKDNGAGFDQQHAAEIFDPFKKLHGEADYPGIGIGLNIAYRIITRHGGEIWAEGETGKGACFYFTLP